MKHFVFTTNGELAIGVSLNGELPEGAREVDPSELASLPAKYRRAFADNNGTLEVDLTKAVDVQLDHLRAARKERLEQLDAEFMIALESGNTSAQAEISAKKQALRDVTEALKGTTPSSLEEIESVQLPAE